MWLYGHNENMWLYGHNEDMSSITGNPIVNMMPRWQTDSLVGTDFGAQVHTSNLSCALQKQTKVSISGFLWMHLNGLWMLYELILYKIIPVENAVLLNANV